MVRLLSIAACVAGLLVFIAVALNWADNASAEQAMLLPPHDEPLVIESDAGPRSFVIEVADEERERSAGLMFRRDLPKDRGMLFIFEKTAQRGFWMRNTPLPLDLLFIAESGRVVAIRKGVPFSEEVIAPIYPVRFVLELHEGTAARLGIRIGARLRHPLIDEISGAS